MNMYRRFAFSLLLIALSALSCFADEPTAPRSAANIAFRDSVVSFLKSEGVVPSVNEDGNIMFKKMGHRFLVFIFGEKAPFFVQISLGLLLDDIDQVALLKAVNNTNLNCRYVKCAIEEDGVLQMGVESYCDTPQVFMDNFKRNTDFILMAVVLLAEFIHQNSSQK